jgi:hypothetical protein
MERRDFLRNMLGLAGVVLTASVAQALPVTSNSAEAGKAAPALADPKMAGEATVEKAQYYYRRRRH